MDENYINKRIDILDKGCKRIKRIQKLKIKNNKKGNL